MSADLRFLAALYAQTRAEELAPLPWPDAAKAAFAETQFALQHRHFLTHHAEADFLVVLRRGRTIGRLYLDRGTAIWRVVDIAIDVAAQGHGLGTALLRWTQRTARVAGAQGIDLHVARDNLRAARLYAALGFVEAIAASSTHRRMAWRAPRADQAPVT